MFISVPYEVVAWTIVNGVGHCCCGTLPVSADVQSPSGQQQRSEPDRLSERSRLVLDAVAERQPIGEDHARAMVRDSYRPKGTRRSVCAATFKNASGGLGD